MNRRIILIFGVLVFVAVLIGIVWSLSNFEAEIAPTPTPGDIILAQVDEEKIGYKAWATQYLLDQLMSELAGQTAPGARETLERMINEILVLRAYPPQHTPTPDEIRQRIQALEAGWRIDDGLLETRLKEINLSYPQYEQMVGRLLTVEAAQQLLMAEQELAPWLTQAWAEANVSIDEEALQNISYFAEETAQP